MLFFFWEVQITIAEFCEGVALHCAQKLSSAHIQAILELTGSDKGSKSINSSELVSLLQVQIKKGALALWDMESCGMMRCTHRSATQCGGDAMCCDAVWCCFVQCLAWIAPAAAVRNLVCRVSRQRAARRIRYQIIFFQFARLCGRPREHCQR